MDGVIASRVVAATATGSEQGPSAIWVRAGVAVAAVLALLIMAAITSRAARGLRRQARKIGWFYQRSGGPIAPGSFAGFPLGWLADGTVDHEITGVWRGRLGKALITSKAPQGYSVAFRVTMLKLTRAMPLVELLPRSSTVRRFDARAEVATGVPEFDARWRVLCADHRFAGAIATTPVIRRLMRLGSGEIPVTVEGSYIYTWVPVHRAGSQDLVSALELLADIAELLPVGLPAVPKPARAQASPAVPFAAAATQPNPMVMIPARPLSSKNYLGLLSILAAVTCFLAPVGIVLGHGALRANRRGEANNRAVALTGLVIAYALTSVLVATYLVPLLVTAWRGGAG